MVYVCTFRGRGKQAHTHTKTTHKNRTFCPAAGISIEELRERIRGLAYLVQDLPHGEMAELNNKVCG